MRSLLLCSSALTLSLTPGCFSLFDSTCEDDDRACLTSPLVATGYNGSCEQDRECKEGLYCLDGRCLPNGTTPRGEKCRLTAECSDVDYCGRDQTSTNEIARICLQAGTARLDEGCGSTGDCRHGLSCKPPNLSADAVASLSELATLEGECKDGGEGEQGEDCESVSDCVAGLTCIDKKLYCDATMICGDAGVEEGDKICAPDIELPPLPPLWEGISCPVVEDRDPKEAYFHVPRANEDDPAEFYSLPFPNDIRRSTSGIDLAHAPLPPPDLGLPVINRYSEVASTLNGFSTNPSIYFRFSHRYQDDSAAIIPTLRMFDITDPSLPEYNQMRSIEWHSTPGRVTNYICPYWLGIRPAMGSPLQPGRTYVALITTGLAPEGGGSFARSADFNAMLADATPGDPALARAHAAYAPMRAWIDDTNQSENQILTAAVFTTHDPQQQIERLRAEIHADALPTLSDLRVCESAATTSPCQTTETKMEDGMQVTETRGGCPTPSPDYTVIHGRIRLPIFQSGTAPYLREGGDIRVDAQGDPVIQDYADVCTAISVPTAAEPAGGFPVLVFAHGTGGNFNGEMDPSGFASPLARGTVPAVVIGIDLPQHGERRGASRDDPEGLFYNFLNPAAARDNVLQGSADLLAVIRWVREGGGLLAGQPLSAGVRFDPTRIALMGHSQGATHSSLIISFEPDIVGAVLSGNGGNLALSLLNKTSPVDIASVVPFGLQDPDDNYELASGHFNPALATVQWVFDGADPVNFAPYLIRKPTASVPNGHHVFMTWGVGDSYSPEETQIAYVRAAGREMPAVGQVFTSLTITETETPWDSFIPPLSSNVTVGSEQRTIAFRQYMPSSMEVDGHFVGTRSGEAGRADVERFLDGLLAGQTPVIGR